MVNVGAGAGSYEPGDREVTAVEPSATMIAQRPPGAAPVLKAKAEDLPFEDGSFDAAMAVLTVHHWGDLDRGLAEMRRVARRRIVLVTFDPEPLRRLWFVRDYFPPVVGLHADRISSEVLAAMLPAGRIEPIPVPRDCVDLFFAALWARPQMVFDDEVVGPMWVWSRLSEEARAEGRRRLAEDLDTGAWAERNAELLEELDVGLRLVVSDLNPQPSAALPESRRWSGQADHPTGGLDRHPRAARRGQRRGALGAGAAGRDLGLAGRPQSPRPLRHMARADPRRREGRPRGPVLTRSAAAAARSAAAAISMSDPRTGSSRSAGPGSTRGSGERAPTSRRSC